MPIELPVDLTPELVPLSWLIGTWEGFGMLGEGEAEDQRIFQRASFTDTGLPVLEYRAETWTAGGDDAPGRPLSVENGFWQLDRALVADDGGPGLVPGSDPRGLANADAVEELRNEGGGFDLQVSISHPRGISELYFGTVNGPQISLATDAVVRGKHSRPYAAATRIFGLVGGDLLWRWDVSEGDGLRAHASAALKKVQGGSGRHHGSRPAEDQGHAGSGRDAAAQGRA